MAKKVSADTVVKDIQRKTRSPSMRRRISANRGLGIPERLMSALGH